MDENQTSTPSSPSQAVDNPELNTGFLFPEWTTKFKKLIGLLAAGGPIFIISLVYAYTDPDTLRIGYQPEQPIPFSHRLHAGEMGMDCRYCHNTVEQAAHAAVPPAETCMNCHSTVNVAYKYADQRYPNELTEPSPDLKPIYNAYRNDEPIEWVRVHDLPDYVMFNHSIHVTSGIGCESCHGRIDQMDKVYQHEALTMSWCLNCHVEPGPNLRPPEKATVMGYKPTAEDQAVIAKLKKEVIPPVNCSTCHK